MSGFLGLYIDDEISTFKSKIIFKKRFTMQKVFFFFAFFRIIKTCRNIINLGICKDFELIAYISFMYSF